MKKIFFFALLSTLLFSMSCSNDFDVAAPWKDIPVVYGFLNIQDNVHYIRVEKAYLDPDANALELAKNPDSLYYPNLNVQLERVSNGQFFTMTKIDGNTVGLPREEGVFATTPNWLYKIDSSAIKLVPGETIRLHVDRGNGLPDVTAETVVLQNGQMRSPKPPLSNTFDFKNNLDTKLSWSADDDAEIFDAKLVFRYAEYINNDFSTLEEKSLEWIWGRGIRNETDRAEIIVEKKGIEFYEVLRNNLVADPSIKRIFQGFDIEIVGGGKALEKYVNVALANTGITGSQELPTYSNLSEGLGVFSSVNYIRASGVLLTQTTRDSLLHGYITKDLNF